MKYYLGDILSKNYEEFKKTIAEMGLEELNNLNPSQIMGNYRNHRVKIYEARLEINEVSKETNYDVEFENPQTNLLGVKRRSFLAWSKRPFFVYSKSKDIRMNDQEFDREFSVKGNKESEIRAILDPSIRNKIMKIGDFNLTIGWSEIGSAWVGFQRVFVTNVVRYVTYQSIKSIKQDADRFRKVLDTVIDIIEKIEANTSI